MKEKKSYSSKREKYIKMKEEDKKKDLTLRARVSAKTEEKKLELLYLRWSEHHKNLCNFIRTKTEPLIYYLPKKPLEADANEAEQRKEQAFEEWKASRREELTEYQKEIGEQYLANVEKELERWQNARNRKANNDVLNLQETMDKELDTHRLEHGPKKRTIPSEYQKEIGEQYLANVEKELERWQNARNRKANNDVLNLQETMDKELDTHRLEHGPKKRIGRDRGTDQKREVRQVQKKRGGTSPSGWQRR
ncbi:uncharacterized protein LOC115704401 [Cannabis sativa]|uniref:uncharacterized protein LOC115704401 n=1 Tax=Cannabis sativa TaxID=3483 RepID=UPI0029CAA8C9|nr:uncharacterized protein LOC115704401 [Cannabis sativa]